MRTAPIKCIICVDFGAGIATAKGCQKSTYKDPNKKRSSAPVYHATPASCAMATIEWTLTQHVSCARNPLTTAASNVRVRRNGCRKPKQIAFTPRELFVCSHRQDAPRNENYYMLAFLFGRATQASARAHIHLSIPKAVVFDLDGCLVRPMCH